MSLSLFFKSNTTTTRSFLFSFGYIFVFCVRWHFMRNEIFVCRNKKAKKLGKIAEINEICAQKQNNNETDVDREFSYAVKKTVFYT